MNIVVLSVQRDTCIIPEQARSGRDACRWPGMISDPSVAGPGLLIFPGGDDITTTTATTKRTRPRPEGLATWRERGCRWKKRGKKKGKLKRGREKEARRCFRTNGNGHAIEKAGSLQFAESSPSPRGSFSVSLFTLDSPRVSLSLSRLFVRSFVRSFFRLLRPTFTFLSFVCVHTSSPRLSYYACTTTLPPPGFLFGFSFSCAPFDRVGKLNTPTGSLAPADMFARYFVQTISSNIARDCDVFRRFVDEQYGILFLNTTDSTRHCLNIAVSIADTLTLVLPVRRISVASGRVVVRIFVQIPISINVIERIKLK